MQNLDAFAFILLGVAVGIGWARRRGRSLGFLALAIVLLSSVSLLGRIPALLHVTPPLLPEISLLAFMGCGYALLCYRSSLIPLPKPWRAAAVVAVAAASGSFLAARYLVAARAVPVAVETAAVIALVLVWSAIVVEPIIRFWLVARDLQAVQAWRLRSLSLGFAGLVAIILFAIAAGAAASNQAVQLAIQVVVIAIVPLLYVSFSPPAWLRREWRASEEDGLRAFMQDTLLLRDDRATLANRALDWAMRLAGGASALALEADGGVLASRGLTQPQVAQIKLAIAPLGAGVNHIELEGGQTSLLLLPIGGLNEGGRLAVLAGPFTPAFGSDEISRVQQFMTAVAAALDRARLLDRLQETNVQLKEANKHKSVFLASMSHELRTPLNAILGFSELLIDAQERQHSPATRLRFLEQIHSSGKHLLGLINDILDLSKIEAGQMELRLQMVSIPDVVDQVRSTVEALAAQKEIGIEADVSGLGEIEADAGKFKQMLLNLVSNAIKFTSAGGSVSISGKRSASGAEISVADSGIGIAASDQARIFNEFQQVDAGVDRQQQGTGLGLALTRRFARLHGGDVHVQSAPGKGSVFTISMPVVAAPQGRVAQSLDSVRTTADGNAAAPLVLVVEDDPPAAELLARQLERAGFRAETVRSGADVLTTARRKKPAAITLDILLPGVDGWEVLTRLKHDEITSSIPVIVISVVDNPELGMALGAVDYFVKPVPAKDLINRLRRFDFGPNGAHKRQVLVVDDERANRDWLTEVLEPAGFGVIPAAGGREAIELARSRQPDLVLLDLMMPEVSGFDVVEALRSEESTSAMPIMILTAKDLTDADKRQLNGRVSTILQRGSTGASDLVGMLRRVIAPEAVEA